MVQHEDKELGLVVEVEVDEYPDSPRDWCNVATFVCWHRRYELGDVQPKETPSTWKEENASEEDILVPLYLYDHSGLALASSPFSCPWDSGQIGWAWVPRKRWEEEYLTRERALATVEEEVKTYAHYLAGEVFDVSARWKGETLASVGGYYGEDAAAKAAKEIFEAWKAKILEGQLSDYCI